MELIDRYLQAVRFWLPREQADDIVAELAEAIHSQMEERQAVLGRGLTEEEVDQLLHRWGSPILVAQRYLPQESLIGPTLYPIYRLVLKWALIFYSVPWFFVWVCFQIFDPNYRDGTAFGALSGYFFTVVFGFAGLTGMFAALEQYQTKTRFLERFNLRRLPKAPNPNHINRSTSVSEAVTYGVTALWWVGILQLPVVPALAIRRSDMVMAYFYWPVLVFLVGLTAVSILNTVVPWWTPRRAAMRLAVNVLGTILAISLLFAGPFFDVTVPQALSASRDAMVRWVELCVVLVLVLSAASYALRAVQDWRRATGRQPLRHWVARVVMGE